MLVLLQSNATQVEMFTGLQFDYKNLEKDNSSMKEELRNQILLNNSLKEEIRLMQNDF